MKIHNLEQNSPEWDAIRAGKITASSWYHLDVNGKQEGGFGVGAITLLEKIVDERITGLCQESFSNRATDWGHAYEDEARMYYENFYFQRVKQVGFVERDDWTGCSPDGLINEDGMGEFKCFPKNHLHILRIDQPEAGQVKQAQFQMWVTGRDWVDLVYYHPNHPAKTKMKVFRIEKDTEYHKRIEERVEAFKALAEQLITRLT